MVKVVSKIVPHVMEISYCFERKGDKKTLFSVLAKKINYPDICAEIAGHTFNMGHHKNKIFL